MNEDILQVKWKQLKGKAQQTWGKLTSDELDRFKGKKDELVGIVQEKYGWSKEKAEKEAELFIMEHSTA